MTCSVESKAMGRNSISVWWFGRVKSNIVLPGPSCKCGMRDVI